MATTVAKIVVKFRRRAMRMRRHARICRRLEIPAIPESNPGKDT
jgi:hypothetical protein